MKLASELESRLSHDHIYFVVYSCHLHSRNYGWEYLAFRFWIGMWVGVILMICVATDASALVCVITRFTEENFAFLIAIIFIKEAFSKARKKLRTASNLNPL